MRYEEFYNEYKETYGKRRKLLRRLPLYIIIGVILIGGFLALFFTSGNAYDYTLEGWSYGEENEVLPKSFLSTSEYEYLVDGQWTTEEPVAPGEYEYRVKSRTIFGRVTHSQSSTLTISRRKTSIQCTISSVSYGGKPLASGDLSLGDTLSSYEFIYDSMVMAETLVQVDASSIVITDRYGTDVTSYYDIETPKTSITFTEVPIVIQLLDSEKVYDGTPLDTTDYEFVAQKLVNGDVIDSIVTEGSITKAGECEITGTDVVIKNTSGETVTNYRVEIRPATLTVTPLEIHVYTEEISSQYFDGEEHTYNTLKSKDELPETDTLMASDSVTAFYAGTYDYIVNPVIYNKDAEDVTDCYIIQKEYGKIHILPSPVTVAPSKITAEYSRAVSYTPDPVITGSTSGAEFSITVTTNQVSAGTGTTEITECIARLDGVDVTDSFDITLATGSITVTKKKITIAAKDETKEYDNLSYLSNEYEITEGGLAEGDALTVTASSDAKAIGDTDAISIDGYQIRDSAKENVNDCYEVTLVPATLTVTKRIISIKVGDSEVTYGEQENITVSLNKGSLLKGHTLIRILKPYNRNIGKNTVELQSVKIVNSAGLDVSGYYEIEALVSGTLTVNKRKITVATASKTVTYDGNVHSFTKDDIYVESGSLLTGETLDALLDPSGTITLAGEVKSSLSSDCFRILDSDSNDITDRYEITLDDGTITVEKKTIYFESGSAIEEYEFGKTLTCDDYTCTGLLAGHNVNTVLTEITGAIDQIGTAANTVSKIVIEDSDENDVTDCYNIIIYEGTLTLVERSN